MNGDGSKTVREAAWWESFGVMDDVMTEACRAVIDAAVTAGKSGKLRPTLETKVTVASIPGTDENGT